MQRRHGEKEAASSSASARVEENGVGAGLLRVCGRCASGCRDGTERGRAGHRRVGSLSNGEAASRGAAGISSRLARRAAGSFGPFAQRIKMKLASAGGVKDYGFAGADVFAVAA